MTSWAKLAGSVVVWLSKKDEFLLMWVMINYKGSSKWGIKIEI